MVLVIRLTAVNEKENLALSYPNHNFATPWRNDSLSLPNVSMDVTMETGTTTR